MAAAKKDLGFLKLLVSTHSHPKVAALVEKILTNFSRVSTHSHPKVAAHYIEVSNGY